MTAALARAVRAVLAKCATLSASAFAGQSAKTALAGPMGVAAHAARAPLGTRALRMAHACASPIVQGGRVGLTGAAGHAAPACPARGATPQSRLSQTPSRRVACRVPPTVRTRCAATTTAAAHAVPAPTPPRRSATRSHSNAPIACPSARGGSAAATRATACAACARSRIRALRAGAASPTRPSGMTSCLCRLWASTPQTAGPRPSRAPLSAAP
mmetsp:Transcript_5264/g.13250  ORF Transcript_5264/g.13250 Transcript_5264/m.13250 type:complete len:214 (-) Transcript_5264:623-1264(-)